MLGKYVHEVQELPHFALSSPRAELCAEELSNIAHPRQTCRSVCILVLVYIPNTFIREWGGNILLR